MKTKRLGISGPLLTRVGLGTWAIGGTGWAFAWGPQDDEDSVRTIHRAIDLGVNWIDTAPVYGFGHSEEVVGRAVKGRRSRLFIATKCGRTWEPGNPVPSYGLAAGSVRRELEASLRRLDTDFIDLYQIHWPNPNRPEEFEEGWGEIARAVKEGTVRFAGVSNFSVQQLERIRPIHPVASVQPPYSMLRRDVERELLPYCATHGIGVIAYSPMQMGLLTGAFTAERVAALPADDLRRNNVFFEEPQVSVNLALVEKLRMLAARRGRTVAQLAIAWVVRRPEVTAAIVGARKPRQIEETYQAADWDLSADDLREVDRLLAERDAQLGT